VGADFRYQARQWLNQSTKNRLETVIEPFTRVADTEREALAAGQT